MDLVSNCGRNGLRLKRPTRRLQAAKDLWSRFRPRGRPERKRLRPGVIGLFASGYRMPARAPVTNLEAACRGRMRRRAPSAHWNCETEGSPEVTQGKSDHALVRVGSAAMPAPFALRLKNLRKPYPSLPRLLDRQSIRMLCGDPLRLVRFTGRLTIGRPFDRTRRAPGVCLHRLSRPIVQRHERGLFILAARPHSVHLRVHCGASPSVRFSGPLVCRRCQR